MCGCIYETIYPSFPCNRHLLYILPFDKAEEKKAALNKVPEQIILSEVRRMVEDMQSMNKKLEETVRLSFIFVWFWGFYVMKLVVKIILYFPHM